MLLSAYIEHVNNIPNIRLMILAGGLTSTSSCFIYFFNFSSATRGHFWNVTALLTSMDHWWKNWSSSFLKMQNLTELSSTEYLEGARISNFWTFWVIIQLIEHLSKIWGPIFLPIVHRCKSAVTFQKWQSWNWKCEKWQSFSFVISALPPDVTFWMSMHFLQLETIVQKVFDSNKMVY